MSCFLTKSSVGKKVVMSLTGCVLVLFVLFHMAMNLVMVIDAPSYNKICAFLGANWYALVATVGLAAMVLIHFVYAFILNLDNYRARGKQRYAVTVKEKGVSWASKNMLALGVVVLLGLILHLVHFWSKMQLVEVMEMIKAYAPDSGIEPGHETFTFGGEEYTIDPSSGSMIMMLTFSKWYNVVLYLIWFVALWFHLTHGFWSMFQTVGLANKTWYPRLKCLGNIVATLIFLGFATVAVVCYIKGADFMQEMVPFVPANDLMDMIHNF